MRVLMLIVLFGLLVAPQISGAQVAFSKSHDDGTNRTVPAGQTIGPNTRFPVLYFHIANLNTDNSYTFQVQYGGRVSVALNARTDAVYGTNGVTVELCKVVSEESAFDEDNCHLTAGAALTGGGTNGLIWDVGPGRYWLNVTAGPTTGAALVVIQSYRTIPR